MNMNNSILFRGLIRFLGISILGICVLIQINGYDTNWSFVKTIAFILMTISGGYLLGFN